jgi:Spy/CpxP family protein refolding chaperone
MANSKNKILLFIIVVLLLVNVVLLFLLAGNRKEDKNAGSRSGRKDNYMTEFLRKDIGFSQEQLVQFDTLFKKHQTRMKPLFDSLQKAKTTFYGQLGKPGITDSSLEQAASNIGERQKTIDLQLFRHLAAIRTICTPEQQPRYDSLINKVTKRIIMPFRRGGNKLREDSTAKQK